ncbi:MAG: hypothetical protein ACO259_08925 [Bacteroidia bacterium]
MRFLSHSQIWIALMASIGTLGISQNHDLTYSIWLGFATVLVYTIYRLFKLRIIHAFRADQLWSKNHRLFSYSIVVISSIMSILTWQKVNTAYMHWIAIAIFGLLLYGIVVWKVKMSSNSPLIFSLFKAGLLAVTWFLLLETPNLTWQKNIDYYRLISQGILLFSIALNFEIRDQTPLKRPLFLLIILGVSISLLIHVLQAVNILNSISICIYFVLAIYTMSKSLN